MSELVNVGQRILYIPKKPELLAYYQVFQTDTIPKAYRISIFVTLFGSLLSIFITILTAYPLSRSRLPGKKAVLFLITFTMLFSGGMIPSYILVKDLRLIDTIWALILPDLVSAFNLIIMMNYFLTIPNSLEESAKLDGANDFTILFRIILPLSLPMLATITLFYAVGYWNAFFNAVLYINDKNLYPLQVILRQILFNASANQVLTTDIETVKASSLAIRMATIIVATVPILLVYPFLQKYFTQGVLIGSVKE